MFECLSHTYSGVTDVSVVLLHTWQRQGQTAVTLLTEPCGEKCVMLRQTKKTTVCNLPEDYRCK